MRKASLYAHFSNKDALFEQVLDIALAEQRAAAASAFASATGNETPGGEYLSSLEARYSSSASFQFLLRTIYAPPLALQQLVVAKYRGFEEDLRALVLSVPTLSGSKAAELAESYLGVVDSLQVELLYNSPGSYAARYRVLSKMLTHFFHSLVGGS